MKKIFTAFILVCSASLTGSAQTLRPDNVDEIIGAMTLEEKVHMVLGTGMPMGGGENPFAGTAGSTYAIPRLGIPSVYLADGPHQLWMSRKREFDSREYNTTEFPTSITVSATWNTEMARLAGFGIGEEVRDYGLDVLLAPSMNIMRNVLCGRNHEYYSEDPVLSGKIAAAYIQGLQSTGAGACVKHFVANNQETNRSSNDARISERALREIYLRGFEYAIKEGKPFTVMTSYGIVNGTYTPESYDLNTTILRDEWGYDGCVMSDWNAGKDPVLSMKAGNNMMQPGQDRQFNAILDAVRSGDLSEDELDMNVRAVLTLVTRSMTFKGRAIHDETDLAGHAAMAREIGGEGAVLLKNASALPFGKDVKKVALYGVASYDIISGGMGFGGSNIGRYTVSLVEGLRNAGYDVDRELVREYSRHLQQEQRRLFPNGRPPFSLTPLPRADEPAFDKASAERNDIAVITLGRKSGEAADKKAADFSLTEGEARLVREVSEAYHAAGKKVVVLLDLCCAIETASWKDSADAIVCTFQGGEQIGNIIADVLSGRVNPSGKLPVTFETAYGDSPADRNFPFDYEFNGAGFVYGIPGQPQEARESVRNVDYTEYEEDIYVGYRYFDTFGKSVSYPFGFGLSYTTFSYELVSAAIDGERCEAKVKITNTGDVAGKEVVELYVKAPDGKLAKPARELKSFAKTSLLAPGESETVVLCWNVMDMASFNDKTSSWELAKGNYMWLVSSSSDKVECSTQVKCPKALSVKAHKAMAPRSELKLLTKK